jgi:hypothetical protein
MTNMVDKYKYAGPHDYIDAYSRYAGPDGAFDREIWASQLIYKKLKEGIDVLPSPGACVGVDEGLVDLLKNQLKEAVDKAKEEVKGLHALTDILKRERMRCEENLDVLSRDRHQIQNEVPKEYYSEATERQAAQYNSVLEQLRAVLELISVLESLIREAEARLCDSAAASEDEASDEDKADENEDKRDGTGQADKKSTPPKSDTSDDNEPYEPANPR